MRSYARAPRRRLSAWRQIAPFVRPATNRVAYVGPGHSTNLGDYCLLEAHRQLFVDLQFAVVPHGDPAPRLVNLDRLTHGRTLCAVALGGGTLIGSGKYRQRLGDLVEAFPHAPRFMLGVGVEDPSPIEHRHMTSQEELRKWTRILRGFGNVRVRGPLSKGLLEEVGLASEIVGDTALVLGDCEPARTYQPRLLGLNLGVSDPIWGGNPRRVLDEVIAAGQILVREGWHIRVMPVWPQDLEYTTAAARGIGSAAEVFDASGDPHAFINGARPCDVFVGEKLHSVVLASTAFVPSVMLAYRPKCLDFQMSIGREEYTIRTSSVDRQRLVEMVLGVSEERASHQHEIFERVSQLRSALRSAAEHERVRILRHTQR